MNTTANGRVSRPNYFYALLFQCLGGRIRKVLIRNQNANRRPGQLQVVDLAPELLGFRHYHDFPRHFRHDLAKAIEFVKSGSTAGQIKTVGTKNYLIKVVRAQYLFSQLALKAL